MVSTEDFRMINDPLLKGAERQGLTCRLNFICFFIFFAALFHDSYGQQIRLTDPKGGTLLPGGRDVIILYEGPELNKMLAEYSLNGGKTWTSIVKSGSKGKIDWKTPNVTSEKCRIRLSEAGNPKNSDSTVAYLRLYKSEIDTFEINRIKMIYSNNGVCSFDRKKEVCGLLWPGDAPAPLPAVYFDGLLFAGNSNSQIVSGGTYYFSNLIPGKLKVDGRFDLLSDSLNKIWKIRKDWQNLPEGGQKARYRNDYENWPVDMGAPWIDVNGDGVYTKGLDKPEILGDETQWCIMHDGDSARSKSVISYIVGNVPSGLEIQMLTYGYKDIPALRDVIFKKYKLRNKGKGVLENLVFGYAADVDLGNANDDYMGCDSLLSLGYIYNGDNDDNNVYGPNPPAVGYTILSGAVVPAKGNDSAYFNKRWIKGFRNLAMTGFAPILKNENWTIYDPDNIQALYNMLHHRLNQGGEVINPHTNLPDNFPLGGDPVNQTGWYEGKGWPPRYPLPYDRRFIVYSGEITMQPSEEQEFNMAIMLARGESNLNSITKLKELTKNVRDFYLSNLPVTDVRNENAIMPDFTLAQNYPNPFNPSTIISYKLNSTEHIALKIFDLLGREVDCLYEGIQKAGEYSVNFNAGHLASGVYFYRLKAGHRTFVRKMALIR